MNSMDHDRLLDLLDHPAPDADAARNPALTAQVMERVRHVGAPQPSPANYSIWLWSALAAVLTLAACTVPGNGLVTDAGLSGAAGLFSGMAVELVVGALIAAAVLGVTLVRTQPLAQQQRA